RLPRVDAGHERLARDEHARGGGADGRGGGHVEMTMGAPTGAPISREAADLPVRDQHAADRDQYQAGHSQDPYTSVRGVAAAEAREGERREDAADEPAEVASVRDVQA